MTRSSWRHRAGTVVAGVALVALPAVAAVGGEGGSAGSVRDTTAGANAAPVSAPVAPDVTTAVTAAGDDAAAIADQVVTASDAGAASSQQSPSTAQAPAPAAAVAVPADETGSTEAKLIQRSCGAPADPHFQPSSGRDAPQCYDKGVFKSSRTYPATHYTNDVDCGDKNLQAGVGPVGLWVAGTAGAQGGYVSVCSDDGLPLEGRGTVRGSTSGSGNVTVDGDRNNPEETSRGWVSATATSSGVTYRCGKPYSQGGRGTADAPTAADNAQECG
jgi:hypothetical protein